MPPVSSKNATFSDPVSLRELCALHPSSATKLAEDCGIAKSVLTNFFAGRRPIPEHARPKLFSNLGLTPTGLLKEEHCFFFDVSQDYVDAAHLWVERIFPRGGKCIRLSDEHVLVDGLLEPAPARLSRWGWAMRSGGRFMLLRESQGLEKSFKPRGKWDWLYFNNAASDLLAAQELRAESVVRLFSQLDEDFTSWSDVQAYSESVGLRPQDVLSMLKRHHSKKLSAGIR